MSQYEEVEAEEQLSSRDGEQFSAQETRDLRFVFDLFDTAGEGRVSPDDARKALRLLGFKSAETHSAVQEALRRSFIYRRRQQQQQQHGQRSRELSFDDFLAAVAKLQGCSYDAHGELMQVVW